MLFGPGRQERVRNILTQEKEVPQTLLGESTMVSPLERDSWQNLPKLQTQAPLDPASPLLEISLTSTRACI